MNNARDLPSPTDGPHSLAGLGPTLDSPTKVAAIWLVSLSVLAVGLATVGSAYSDTEFAADYLWTQLIVAIALVAIAITLHNRGQIGLRRPSLHLSSAVVAPLFALSVMAVGAALSWFNVPANSAVDYGLLRRTLLSLGLVGFTEEVMYRGVLSVVLVRLLGFRRGIITASLLFGALHFLNVIAGQSLSDVAGQFVTTTMLGFMFVTLALATRSLWIAIVVHAAYDIFLISDSIFKDAGSDGSPVVAIGSTLAVAVGVVALVRLWRAPDHELYEPVPSAS